MKINYIKSAILFVSVQFISIFAQAQSAEGFGKIFGTVKDKTTHETLTGVNIVISGTNIGAITDLDGKFQIRNLKSGEYNLIVTYTSYKTEEIKKISLEPNKNSEINIELEQDSKTIETVTVTANKVTNTEFGIINSVRTTLSIANGISSQLIMKTQDKDASEVVRRIPGITIIDDRFIIVRGLSQRYNSVWLNNAGTPSFEADVRAFSFDAIPSSMIDNLLVYKTMSPELPADFAGGFIKIITKNLPDKNNFTVSYSTSFNEGTTGKDFYTNPGGKFDFLGFDDGSRALPKDMPQNLNSYSLSNNSDLQNKVVNLGKEFNNNWGTIKKTASPDQRFSLSLNKKFEAGNIKIGNTTFLNYSNTYDKNQITNNSYSIYNFSNDRPSFAEQDNDEQYSNTAKLSLLHNWVFVLPKGDKIEIRNMLNQIGLTRTTFRNGIDWYNDARKIKSAELRYMSRTIYSGQISETRELNNETGKLDFTFGYSYANKKEPNLKRYKMIQDPEDSTKFIMLFGSTSNPDLASESVFYTDMSEKVFSGTANYSQKLKISNFEPELKTGFYIEDKNRQFTDRTFGFSKAGNESLFGITSLSPEEIFVPDNFNSTTGIKLMESTDKSDSYKAGNYLFAGYAAINIPISKQINIYTGARIEENQQFLSSCMQGTTIPVNVNRDNLHIFPSANLTYNINSKNAVRAAYGESINRPEFREIAPFYFVDFDENAGIYGNPDIKECIIHNYDLRYELYPKTGELFTVSTFYKKFNNPIEVHIQGNNPMQYSFQNVNGAISYGIETELRKSLDFINSLRDFSLVFNASYIKSKVIFDGTTLETQRPMQGQSPYIVNTGIFYQNTKLGISAGILYNTIGKRITAVGRPSPNAWESIPDIYEMPRHVIDFTFSKTIGKHIEIKAGIKDILNQAVVYQQNINTDVDMSIYTPNGKNQHFDRTQINKQFNPGRYITVGFSYQF
jgi:hypothetical protein